jgi:hypothetical protein
MSELENNGAPKSSKRQYKTRKGEFLEQTTEQLLGFKTQLNDEIKVLNSKMDKSSEEVISLKELTHKRVRLYKRLRDLGVNCSEIRSKKSQESQSTSENNPV